jgi:hypothetical protein
MKPVALFSWQSFGTFSLIPQSASIGVAPDILSEEEKEDRATEAMDKAMKELDEELEDAREFAFKALEIKAEP